MDFRIPECSHHACSITFQQALCRQWPWLTAGLVSSQHPLDDTLAFRSCPLLMHWMNEHLRALFLFFFAWTMDDWWWP